MGVEDCHEAADGREASVPKVTSTPSRSGERLLTAADFPASATSPVSLPRRRAPAQDV